MPPSTSTPAGWLVVGLGRHADRYGLPALARARLGGAVAVCGSDPARAADVAARHAVPAWGTSLEDLLADPAVTHVYVCSGNDRHERQTTQAASAGKHVLCEKPLAPAVEPAHRMVEACRRLGVALGTGFHLRHNPAHQRARRMIVDGELGSLLWIRIEYVHALAPGDTTTRLGASRDIGTPSRGAMSGTGAHAVDLARWLLDDEILDVTATMAESADGPQRFVHVTGTTARGVLVTLTAGRSRHPANGVTVVGTRGRLEITGSIGGPGAGTVRVVSGAGEQAVELPPHDPYTAQFDAFVGGTGACATGADGLVSLQVVEAVERHLGGVS
ncbi:Gfo/Idh/MocA family oxidoreductase [Phytohabitans sp. ZYX-F-186]|uniref:Gfo/Idh/MocA family oxidoreductase n=1 Tax=Phytohabitans maris TaxID=3071409 RepID=A0ABU0ZE45_9ACTN|nr:Gfo/Idh/MocA family oxidoreductase [Phytohabitans sp. ZYX-F-186]MDQ7904622.1 Gfo/Idh/MocA family oxidoreductase [Phytohabitans sp. ZYX-F-186]